MTPQPPNPPSNQAGLRAQLRVTAAVVWTASALTLQYVAPGFPEPLVAAYGGVWMASVGLGEALYDSRRGR